MAKEVGIVPTAFYRHFESIDALGLALVEESFVSLRAMLRDVRRNDPALDDVVDSSLQVLVEHVHAQREHFLFIARERAAGPLVVREAIAHGIELFERELALDLARLPGTGALVLARTSGPVEPDRDSVVATAEAILSAPAARTPSRRSSRPGPDPAAHGADRRPQLALRSPDRLSGRLDRPARGWSRRAGRSRTCRIASATVSGRIQAEASYSLPSCSCTFSCIGVAVRPG